MREHPSISALGVQELRSRLSSWGTPAYRADQIRHHLWWGRADGFAEMDNLPASLRLELQRNLSFSALDLVEAVDADRGLTTKLLFRTSGDQEIESVMIAHPPSATSRARRTVCVSSQAGCAIGCVFCATGQLGLRANLEAAEIVDQVLEASRRWKRAGQGAPTNVVYMGMGEPLQNYSAVVESIRLLREWGVPHRQVVVSTSGLVPEIDRLASEGLAVRLAISLHAADDRLRDQLVPLNRRYPISSLLEASIRYATTTGRRVSLEYVLISGVNDDPASAGRLRELAETARAHVNLIPMNPVDGIGLRAPTMSRCRDFVSRVGPRATLRVSRGDRASAACGQLRASLSAQPRRLARLESAASALVSGTPAGTVPGR